MYGFPLDLNIPGMHGAHLQQICLGAGDVQLHFSGGISVCIQHEIEIRKGETSVATWTQRTYWSSLEFQQIFNKEVTSYRPLSSKTLQIDLEDDLHLFIHDQDHYESTQISWSDGTEII